MSKRGVHSLVLMTRQHTSTHVTSAFSAFSTIAESWTQLIQPTPNTTGNTTAKHSKSAFTGEDHFGRLMPMTVANSPTYTTHSTMLISGPARHIRTSHPNNSPYTK